MTTRRVYFDESAIFIDGTKRAFIAGSLTYETEGDVITVWIRNGTLPVTILRWQDLRNQASAGFNNLSEAAAYLDTVFAQRAADDDENDTIDGGFF